MSSLPIEIEWHILQYLTLSDLLPLSIICSQWCQIIYDIIKKSKLDEITSKYLANIVYHNPQLVDHLYHSMNHSLKNKVCASYAYLGDKMRIKYCLENGAEWTERAVCYAFHGGQKELIETYGTLEIDMDHLQSIYDMNLVTNQIHQQKNQLMYQKYCALLEESHLQKKQTLIEKYGSFVILGDDHLDLYKKLRNLGHQFIQNDCIQAIINDNLITLEWLIQCDQMVDLTLIYTAIKYHRLKIFDFLYHHYNFETHASTIKQYVLKYGNLSFLEKMIQYKIIPSSRDALVSLSYGHVHMFRFLHQKSYINITLYALNELESHLLLGCKKSLTMKNMDIIKWLLNLKPQLSVCIGEIAASNNDFTLLKWLIHNQYHLDLAKCCSGAVLFNQMHILSYVQKLNHEIITNQWAKYLRMAVQRDCLQVVKWLIEHRPTHFNIQIMQISLIAKKIHLYLPNQQSISIKITKTNKRSYSYLNEMLKKKIENVITSHYSTK